jgi:hypothetical protein
MSETTVKNITVEKVMPPVQTDISVKVKGVELFYRINGKWNWKASNSQGYYYSLSGNMCGENVTKLLEALTEDNG